MYFEQTRSKINMMNTQDTRAEHSNDKKLLNVTQPQMLRAKPRPFADLIARTRLRREGTLEPDPPIVDPHHDVWLNRRGRNVIDELADLLRTFPETSVMLNFVGGLLGMGPYGGKPQGVFETLSYHLRALTALPNLGEKSVNSACRVAAGISICVSCRLHPKNWLRHGGRISTSASTHLPPTAAYGKAIFGSTCFRAVTTFCGTRSGVWPVRSARWKSRRSAKIWRANFTAS